MTIEPKTETFDVIIVGKYGGEIIAVAAAAVKTKYSLDLLETCEARIVPAGKYKVGDKLEPTR